MAAYNPKDYGEEYSDEDLKIVFVLYESGLNDPEGMKNVEAKTKWRLEKAPLSKDPHYKNVWKLLMDNALAAEEQRRHENSRKPETARDTEGWRPSEAVEAWAQLEQYALNLVRDPDSPYFRKIRSYNGYLMTTVRRSVPVFKDILERMGYDKSQDVYELKPGTAPGKDKLTKVAFSCFLCKVQCSIMHEGLLPAGIDQRDLSVQELFHTVSEKLSSDAVGKSLQSKLTRGNRQGGSFSPSRASATPEGHTSLPRQPPVNRSEAGQKQGNSPTENPRDVLAKMRADEKEMLAKKKGITHTETRNLQEVYRLSDKGVRQVPVKNTTVTEVMDSEGSLSHLYASDMDVKPSAGDVQFSNSPSSVRTQTEKKPGAARQSSFPPGSPHQHFLVKGSGDTASYRKSTGASSGVRPLEITGDGKELLVKGKADLTGTWDIGHPAASASGTWRQGFPPGYEIINKVDCSRVCPACKNPTLDPDICEYCTYRLQSGHRH